MKKYKSIYTLLGMSLLIGGCQDEPVTVEGIKVVPGEEIQFGATAHFEDGDAKTRTEYGTISGNKIEVNWVANEDKLQIASPHTAGVEVAEYQVANVSSSEDENGNDTYVEQSKATTLQRIGDAGLQWTNNTTYEFYAMYPSHNQLKEVVTEVADVENYGLKTSVDADGNQMGSMTGYLPVRQDPKSEDIPTSPNADNTYVIKPDMRYAYMVAKAYYTVPDDGIIDSEDEKIQLPFSSLVTALQFQLKANEIGMQTDGTQQITITALTLFSASGADICGKFKYTYPQGTSVDVLTDGTFETLNDATGYNQVIMELGDGITLTKNQSVDATFFLLPSVEQYAAKDLKLTVHFKVAGQPQVRTATINRDLMPKKKYYFKNLLLPVIPADLEGSSWWSALDPNTLLSQVSIPVAGNVFSNSYTESDATYHKEQVLDYQTLWNLGVRGFELVTGYGAEGTGETVENLGDTYFVCGEKVLSSGIKFAEAFESLASFAETGSGYEDETLVLICKYHAVSDKYSPQDYVTELIEYLEEFVVGNEYGLTKENFVRINANTTVGDLMGNIAIIIRPGDDDYMKWVQSTHTSSIDMGDWADNLMLVQNWGVAYDRWDKRYSGYTREATWGKKIGDGKLCVEDSLYSFGASGDTYASLEAYDYGGSFSTGAWQKSANTDNTSLFAHPLTNYDGGVAYVQEWARVVPQIYDNVPLKYTNEDPDNGCTLWFKWPESITEKKTQIDKLFTASVATKGGSSTDDLFINVLSGYYITPKHQNSFAPYNQTFIAGTEEVVGRYTPKIADTEDEAEACYIKFQKSNCYIYNGSTTALNASYSAQGNSSEWKLIGTGTDNFILKNSAGYYVSGISGSYVQVSANQSSAATLRLKDNESATLSLYWDIEFVDIKDSNGYSRFNQFGGATGDKVGVWSSDAGCAVYFEPCNGTHEGTIESDGTAVRTDALWWTPRGQGNGGNYAALAADLNSYVYGILSGTQNLSSTSARLPEGPWGLVVIDYIGATQDEFMEYGAGEFVSDLSSAVTASSKLVDLIMMNNFKFPLALRTTTGESGGDSGDGDSSEGDETQGASVTFSGTFADPSQSVQ